MSFLQPLNVFPYQARSAELSKHSFRYKRGCDTRVCVYIHARLCVSELMSDKFISHLRYAAFQRFGGPSYKPSIVSDSVVDHLKQRGSITLVILIPSLLL